MSNPIIDDRPDATLCEALDRILHRGAVVQGDLVIRVADIDLLYLNLRVFLSSIDRAIRSGAIPARTQAEYDALVKP